MMSLRRTVADLYPGYFALVMATGVISVASYQLGFHWLGWILFGINLVASPSFPAYWLTCWITGVGRDFSPPWPRPASWEFRL